MARPVAGHVGAGQRLHAAEMEAAGRRDENAPDEDEKTRPPISVRQVHGFLFVVVNDIGFGDRSHRHTQIAVEKPVQVSLGDSSRV